jgi:hypothetical protein
MQTEQYQFLAADYSATGEGRTICLLITRAYPHKEDYVRDSYFDEEGKFVFESETKNTAEYRAKREFVVRFGGFIAEGVEVLEREEFLTRFGRMLPDSVKHMLLDSDHPGNMVFSQEFHFNFS